MATALATIRTTIATALAGVTSANIYRRRQTNLHYPCLMIGWPTEFDVRAALDAGGSRDATIPVHVGVEVADDDSSDDLLSTILESTVTALLVNNSFDVQPATDFGEGVTDDGRTILWATLPVKVFA
jgi:hypothetical protein